jgi:hypothetical protein
MIGGAILACISTIMTTISYMEAPIISYTKTPIMTPTEILCERNM